MYVHYLWNASGPQCSGNEIPLTQVVLYANVRGVASETNHAQASNGYANSQFSSLGSLVILKNGYSHSLEPYITT